MDLCPTCATPSAKTRLSVRTDQDYRVLRCPSCGLAFTVPRPTPDELTAFYQDTYFTKADPESRLGYVDYEGDSWAAINADRTWDDLADWAPETRDVPRTLLDIGGATGAFAARALNDGWHATVCELGDTARAKAAEKGLATIATLDQADGPFGLITMFHVLEHVIDPSATLAQARDLIRPDGLLAIELPQWRSAGRIIRRSQWAQLRPPEHINFFTRASLAEALHRAGWEVVRSSTPYPRAAELAADAVRRRDAKLAVRHAGRLIFGAAGLGGYLRTIARPV